MRLGIIGCGKVSWERHAPALKRVPEIAVESVCDVNAERAERAAALFGAERSHGDYRALLAERELDAVAVLTETAGHGELGCAVLGAGKHLFLEKPLALTVEEGRRLVEAGRRSGRVAQVCFNLRWHRLAREARELVRSGVLGRVKAVRSVYTHDRTGVDAPDWHRKLELGGGVSFNEGVHHFDLWRYLLGVEVEEVHALSAASAAYEDETSVVAARLGGGVAASAVMSFLTGPNSEVEIYGEKGRLVVSLYRFDGLQFYSSSTYPGDYVDRLKRGWKAVRALPVMVEEVRNGGSFQATFAGCWQGFAESVRTGAEPGCTLEDGLKALEVALAARASIGSGKAAGVGRG